MVPPNIWYLTAPPCRAKSARARCRERPDRAARQDTRTIRASEELRETAYMFRAIAFASIAATLAVVPASAQDTIKIPNIIELSGAGATVGTNWRNGSVLAVEEINAAGASWGRRSNWSSSTQRPTLARLALASSARSTTSRSPFSVRSTRARSAPPCR